MPKGYLAERTPKYSFLDGTKTLFFQEKTWFLLRL
jgi:outer membrane lipoprotein-sorting protein